VDQPYKICKKSVVLAVDSREKPFDEAREWKRDEYRCSLKAQKYEAWSKRVPAA